MSLFSRSKWINIGIGSILPLLLLLGGEIICRLEIFPPQIVIAPHEVFVTFWGMVESGELAGNIGISIFRVFSGFLIGTTVGFMVGSAMALSPSMERTIAPTLNAIRQVPLFAWIPLLLLWLGIGEGFKVAFIAIGAFYPMVVNTFDGIHGVPRSYLEVARAFGFGPFKLLWRVLIPAALPSLFTGIKLALGISWMLVVGAELVAAGEGIGYLMTWGRQLFQLDIVFVAIIVVGFIGYSMFQVLALLEMALLRWQQPSTGK